MKLNALHDTERYSVVAEAGAVMLAADIFLPPRSQSLVIFAHGSGSSRHSPRNRLVASELNEAGMATMLVDLLTENEELIDQQTSQYRFDIDLLANRLVDLTDWAKSQSRFEAMQLGYFGASTGAAAALQAAAARPNIVKAIVSRGGRPDLADKALPKVAAATLFIVGSDDYNVLRLNQRAMSRLPMTTVKELEIVVGASHLFEEPGTLQKAAHLARVWFLQYLMKHERNQR